MVEELVHQEEGSRIKTKAKTKKSKKLSEYDEFMSYPDFDKATLYFAAKRAHAVLSAAIKQALGLKQWPNFDHHPRNALMCQCIGKLLIDSVAKLRADQLESQKEYDRMWKQSI